MLLVTYGHHNHPNESLRRGREFGVGHAARVWEDDELALLSSISFNVFHASHEIYAYEQPLWINDWYGFSRSSATAVGD